MKMNELMKMILGLLRKAEVLLLSRKANLNTTANISCQRKDKVAFSQGFKEKFDGLWLACWHEWHSNRNYLQKKVLTLQNTLHCSLLHYNEALQNMNRYENDIIPLIMLSQTYTDNYRCLFFLTSFLICVSGTSYLNIWIWVILVMHAVHYRD